MSKFFFAAAIFAALASGYLVTPASDTVSTDILGPIVPVANKVKGPGFCHLGVKYHQHNRTNSTTHKRQSSGFLRNDISSYSVQIGVGTPPQVVEVALDTGSNELWVNPNCVNAYDPYGCVLNGLYTPYSSSTAVDLGKTFSISYGIGSASGEYYTDKIQIGGANLNITQFGNANNSVSMMEGIMGIGWGYGVDTTYYNVIDQLYHQGITASRAFGLNLGSIDTADGSIIFGGIDSTRFIGALEKRPIIPPAQAPDHYARYWFYMTGVGITPPGATKSTLLTPVGLQQGVFPDSGSTFCYLPAFIFNALLAQFPSPVSMGGGLYTVACSLRNEAGTIDFMFGNKTIHVSYYEFLWFDGVQCWFAAQAVTNTFLLGDSFMRSAYIVYDQDNKNILLAQATTCTGSVTANIIPISTGVNAVPSVTGGCFVQGVPTTTTSTTSTKTISTTSTTSTTTTSKISTSTTSTSTTSSSSSIPTTTSTSSSKFSSSTSANFTNSSSSLSLSASLISSSSKLSISSSNSSSSSTRSTNSSSSTILPATSTSVSNSSPGSSGLNSNSSSSHLSSFSSPTSSTRLSNSTSASISSSSSSGTRFTNSSTSSTPTITSTPSLKSNSSSSNLAFTNSSSAGLLSSSSRNVSTIFTTPTITSYLSTKPLSTTSWANSSTMSAMLSLTKPSNSTTAFTSSTMAANTTSSSSSQSSSSNVFSTSSTCKAVTVTSVSTLSVAGPTVLIPTTVFVTVTSYSFTGSHGTCTATGQIF